MDIQSLLNQVKNPDSNAPSPLGTDQLKQEDLSSLLTKEAFKNDPELESMIQEFSMRMASQQNKQNLDDIGMIEIEPLPGFVIKTKLARACEDYPEELKVFVNICHSPLVPAPPPISKEELAEVIQSGDSSSYRIPLSLSPSQTDYDKAGNICLVFDACVNSNTLDMALNDNDFKVFLMVLAVEWVEEKHKLLLVRGKMDLLMTTCFTSNRIPSWDVEFSLPKMKSKGTLRKQTIRKTRKPIIADMTDKKKKTSGPLAVTRPEYVLFKEPSDNPEYIIVQLSLPDLESTADSFLEVEEQRFMFLTPNKYQLDLPLDVCVDIDTTVAQYDRSTRKLNVTMKVLSC